MGASPTCWKRCTSGPARAPSSVYNPYAILHLFASREFKAHWFETATPRFLVDTLLQRGFSAPDLENVHADDDLLSAFEPFDLRAAIEAAESQRRAIDAGSKKSGAAGPWQKVKVDRQIVAIAKVHGVDELYSDDDDVRRLADADGAAVRSVTDLPLPPADPQPPLFSDPEPESS